MRTEPPLIIRGSVVKAYSRPASIEQSHLKVFLGKNRLKETKKRL